MQYYVWSPSTFASFLPCCKVSQPFVYKLFYAFCFPHGKKKKSKTNEGANKRMRKATDVEKRGEKNSSDTGYNPGSKTIHLKHFQYIPIHDVAVRTEPCFKSWGTYASNPYSLNVIPVISPVMGSSTFTFVNRFHTTVIRTTILDYNYLSLAFQQASCKIKIQQCLQSNNTH